MDAPTVSGSNTQQHWDHQWAFPLHWEQNLDAWYAWVYLAYMGTQIRKSQFVRSCVTTWTRRGFNGSLLCQNIAVILWHIDSGQKGIAVFKNWGFQSFPVLQCSVIACFSRTANSPRAPEPHLSHWVSMRFTECAVCSVHCKLSQRCIVHVQCTEEVHFSHAL